MKIRPATSALLTALFGSTALSFPALASCRTSGDNLICTGVVNFVFVDESGLYIEDLTKNVQGGVQNYSLGASADPSSNGGNGGNGSTITTAFYGKNFGIVSSSQWDGYPPVVGLLTKSEGGFAASGDHKTEYAHNAHADDGGYGGDAGGASAFFYSGFIDFSSDKPAILLSAQSYGGYGGDGGEGRAHVGGAAYGGNGGIGGQGRDATVSVTSGRFNLVSTGYQEQSYGFLAQSLGGTGGLGGKGHADNGNAHGRDGGDGNDAATAKVDVTSASITMSGYGAAVAAHSIGGDGNRGGDAQTDNGSTYGGDGGLGGDGGTAEINFGSGKINVVTKGPAKALEVLSRGGSSGDGGNAHSQNADGHGGDADAAGNGGDANLALAKDISISAEGNIAVHVGSLGADGGKGGDAKTDIDKDVGGGDGGRGGFGGNASITSTGGPSIISTGTGSAGSHAVLAESIGGRGGNGGDATSDDIGKARGGNGGAGGSAGAVNVDLWADVTTQTDQSQGVYARSYGGAGGDGGNADAAIGKGDGGAGAGSAPGGAVTVEFKGSVTTGGEEANAVFANSVGGLSGAGGSGSGFGGFGAGSQSAGDGGQVSVSLSGATLTTKGASAYGVQALSVGGGGGRAGKGSGIVSLGGTGSAGGTGRNVSVSADSGTTITTHGRLARGIHAATIGGGGGDGGGAGGIVSLGGSGGKGGNGSRVTITNHGEINTKGGLATGIYALSLGGGGGSAHSTKGLAAIGGSGGGGGLGGPVTIANSGVITTKGDDADAVFAQSVGGGGGHGSNAYSGGFGFSQAIGGQGGNGNFANSVTYTDTGSAGRTISTSGDRSRGVFLQSVGGGGGNGGNAVSVSGGAPVNLALGFNGSGGTGGDSNWVQYINGKANIITAGDHSAALHLQTVGGGGGNAGSALAFTGPSAVNFALGVGASGSGGGDAGTVWMGSQGSLTTSGDFSPGLLAQTIGGGGGNSGNTISGNLGGGLSIAPSIGGSGGTGGNSGDVTISGGGGILTKGKNSRGITAQAVGGGGGNGGATVAASGISQISADVAIGGSGGSGGKGGKVTLNWSDEVATHDANSAAVLAQSIGGGGGSSGTTVSGAANSQFSAQLAVGGSGGSGGSAGDVKVNLTGALDTGGALSAGLVAQSIGGGGGNAGATLAGTAISNMSANVSVGGSGGHGGDAGSVTVLANDVSTKGASSAGVEALSVGGGGGSAHFTGSFSYTSAETANVAVGGKGGAAGDGGTVSVGIKGSIATLGHNSSGVSALSVGGGGGNGSWTVAGSLSGSVPIGVTVGGDGGTSGSGGKVTVITDGGSAISTAGKHSDGILAGSIARAGGSAGYTLTGSGFSGATAGVSVGGNGGKGGNAGDVNVTNGAKVTTKGNFANAVVAHSLGGGGGSAKGSIDASALSMGDASVTVGGKGGEGGRAGNVAVASTGTAALTTTGHHSVGILAQSVGGSGGNGGFAAEGSLTAGKFSGEIGVSVGGAGGHGGQAGKVSVNQLADISTSDYGSTGILAQSIGGSGGNGGNVYAGNFSFSTKGSATVNVDLGGTGGAGATADAVTVNSGGAITTDGYHADGILAQSIGGNGGRGGTAYTALATVNKGSSLNIGVDVGGDGGTGQDASTVNVENSGAITTKKGGSNGILAMSVGGGGGRGGSAANLNIEPLPSSSDDGGDDSSSLSGTVQFSIGGSGGAGGNGEDVMAKNTGTVTTLGDSSKGIYAISIGGGGGEGGTASATSFSFDGVCSALTGGKGYGCKKDDGNGGDNKTTNISASLSVAIGGNGGAAGNAGNVEVENDGAVMTSGDISHGLIAHSIGGGGGNGGDGDLGIEGWTTNEAGNAIADLPGNFTFIPKWTDLSAAVGGSGGAAGKGGTVTAGGKGTITTTGDHAFGIHAQSVGGGGGNAGAGVSGLWSYVTVGGRGSGGGNGGAVTVDQSGAIVTKGEGGIGIFAQSVGGGGGTAGDVEKGFSDKWLDLNIGAGVGWQESPGAGGHGGTVTVTAGPITTSGVRAHGIVVQSVGGSGGVAGISGALGNADISNFAGGSGDAGNGGDATITTNGAINVSGEWAHGIFAQSTAGRQGSGDTSGDVTIDVNADIIASGTNGRAILAQSAGGSNDQSGTIKITVADGATVRTAADGAETIGVRDGRNNVIINHGVIRHADIGGYVIRTDGPKLAIQNSGFIQGSVLSRGLSSIGEAISIDNTSGAVFGLGTTFNLGSGGSIKNAGTISAGGMKTVGATKLTGTLNQVDGGTMHVDYQFDGTSDTINVVDGGQTALAGSVLPFPVGTPPRDQDSGTVTFLYSRPGVISDTMTVANTSTVNYSLGRGTSSDGRDYVNLSYKVDYTPWNGSAEAQAKVPEELRRSIAINHTEFGNHVDELVRVRRQTLSLGGSNYAFVDDLALSLLRLEDVSDLVDVYGRFAPGEVFAHADAAMFSSLRFADELNSCPSLDGEGTVVFGTDGACAWTRLGGVARRGDTAGLSHGYDEDVFSLSAGTQFEPATGWLGGVAVGYERYNISSSGMSGDGHRFQAGAILKRQLGPTTLSGSISGGWGTGEMQRQTFTPNGFMWAESDVDHAWVSPHARLSHRFDVSDTVYLKPWFDIGVEHIWQDGYRETGVGPYGLDVGSVSDTYVTLSPMVEVAAQFDFAGVATRASLKGGALAIVGGSDRSTEVRLAGMNGAGPTYTVRDEVDTLYGRLGASIEAEFRKGMTFETGVETLFGDNRQEYSGMVRLNILF